MLNPKIKINIKAGTESSRVRTSDVESAKRELSRSLILAFSAIGGLTASFAVACLIGGLVASGGPLSLIKAFFTALTGYF